MTVFLIPRNRSLPRQGGTRVRAIAARPGKTGPGNVSDHVRAFWDFMPTAAVTLSEDPPARCDDILSVSTLLGKPEEQQQHEYLHLECVDEQLLRIANRYVYRPHPDKPIEIYDNDQDPGQFVDLAAKELDLVSYAEEITRREHETNIWFPAPGQSHEA